MNKNIFAASMIIVSFLAGCGDRSETQPEGAAAMKSNYIAEGMAYLKQSNIEKAIASFDQAIKQDPRNPENYITLGKVYMNLKAYNRAVDTLSAAVLVDPDSADAYYWLAINMSLDGRKDPSLVAAQKSVELFAQQKNELRFKQSVALLKKLTEGTAVSGSPAEMDVSVPAMQ